MERRICFEATFHNLELARASVLLQIKGKCSLNQNYINHYFISVLLVYLHVSSSLLSKLLKIEADLVGNILFLV